MTIRTASATHGLLTGALLLVSAGTASAATLTVSNAAVPCPGAAYATIQSAVNAAAPHDTIAVCAGTYAEQISIPVGKNGLVLHAKGAAVIKAPAVMNDPGDVVRVNGARDVTVEGFTITGPLPNALFCSPFPRTGVRIDGGGSATVRRDRITDIRSEDPSFRGCQSGVAILVGNQTEGEIGSALIEQTTIEAYQKSGIVVDNAGSSAIVVDNDVLGDGPTEANAQNGIQVSNGADALVGNNRVGGQIYSPSPLASALLFFHPGKLSVVGNHVRDADNGLILVDASGPEIRDNAVAGCTGNGIDLDEDTTGTTGARVSGNESHDNGLAGIFVSASSTGNTIRRNRMFANADVDARDASSGTKTAGTGNEWVRNHCKTDNHGGLLCAP